MRSAPPPVLFLSLAMALAASPVPADTVKMNNNLEIEGKVQQETPEYIILLVYDGAGKVRIEREKIKEIVYDFDSRKDDLAEEDIQGHYELGKWAFSRGMYKEAIGVFEAVKGKAGVGPDLYKLLGLAYDHRKELEKAFQAFQEHLRLNPEDAQIKKRGEELAKELGLTKTEPVETPKPGIVEGTEATFRWYGESWDDANPCVVTPKTDPDTGNKLIFVELQPGKKQKWAFSGVEMVAKPIDLTEKKEIAFKAFHNNAQPIDFSIALINEQFGFFETKGFRIPPNSWVEKTIPIQGKVFKCEKNWNSYEFEIENRSRIRRVTFLVSKLKEGCRLYIDQIEFK